MRFTKRRLTKRELGICLLGLIVASLLMISRPAGVDGQGSIVVTTVSAASYTGQLAPETIAASFGSGLATQTLAAMGELPTNLGGTTVQVGGQAAQIFFVSPNQVNFLIPSGVTPGTVTVTITSGSGAVSTGTAIIGGSAPGIFTLDATGTGLPAAYLLRFGPGGGGVEEPINQPINLGPASDRVFLVMFLTGLRSGGAVQVHIGGTAFTPDFVGPAPGFVGLEQINLELSRTLAGRGRLPMFVTVNGAQFSNVVDIEFLSAGGPPQITNFAPVATLAGDELTIDGNGFSGDAANNKVAILDAQGNPVWAQVTAATANQLRVRVPYGAQSGRVMVQTPQGEVQSAAQLAMRTSVSGFLEQIVIQNNVQMRRPVPNVTVRVRPASGAIVTRQTGPDGAFVAGDLAPGLALIDVDPIATQLPFPSMRLKMPVVANRDNQYPNAVELTQVQGNSLSVNAGQQGGAMTTITTGNLSTNFGLPSGCIVFQPPNVTTNVLTISLFNVARTPLNLPVGAFSSGIAQVTPFGARMSPGGTLRLPNPEGLITDRPVFLYRLIQPTQQITEPPEVGEFIQVGTGIVINDGRIDAVETGQPSATNGISQTTYYFASPVYPLATISGRVLGSDGEPISRAVIRSRGQSTFTGGDGRFTLQNIPVIRVNNDSVTLDVSYVRPDGVVDRTEFGPVGVTANANIAIGADITLAGRLSADQPLLVAPPRLAVNQNQTLDFTFLALSQPQPGQVVAVAATGAPFATVTAQGNGVFTLRLAPGTATAATYLMRLTVTAGSGARYIQTIPVRVRAPGNQPTADDQSLLTAMGMQRSFTLVGRDPLNRNITIPIVSLPTNGSISGVGVNLTYTPNPGFTGIDTLNYRVSVTGTATVSDTSTVYLIVR
ncbi:MAG: hypothetical protein KF868_19280 [Acidobacteria bacterium]|nr:hypothetical protein [Acidobacteriota bacterium]MCW5969323.1 hypothetical protein [Blastocatellales bacterium]